VTTPPNDPQRVVIPCTRPAGQRRASLCDAGWLTLIHSWGKKVTGWLSVNIYEWTIYKPIGQTLDELQQNKQEAIEQELVEPASDAIEI